MGTNLSAGPIEQTRALHWIALSLTPGLGPTRARHLVEFFGSIEPIFHSSLTSLEAAGIPRRRPSPWPLANLWSLPMKN